MRVLLTGGYGFVGTAIARSLLRQGYQVLNLDKLTYASAPEALAEWGGYGRYRVVNGDVCDIDLVLSLFEEFQPDSVVHAASESHFEPSETGAARFLQTSHIGTFTMLEAARHWWAGRPGEHRFHHISTDEACESAPTASKALAEHLVRAWGETYGLPTVTTTCASSYGPWQLPEKLIPFMITRGAEACKLPVCGSGQDVRDWIHIEDHADAVRTVLEHGRTGETYHVNGTAERTNLDVARMICEELDAKIPGETPHARWIEQNEDGSQQYQRCAVDGTKIRRELGWRPVTGFREGLLRTVDWYLANRQWWQSIPEHSDNRQTAPRRAA